MLTDLAFEGRRPGHELESEAVIDHGEAARREREALPVGARHILARCGLRELSAGLGRELLAKVVDLDDVDLLLTDDALDPDLRAELTDAGLTVELA